MFESGIDLVKEIHFKSPITSGERKISVGKPWPHEPYNITYLHYYFDDEITPEVEAYIREEIKKIGSPTKISFRGYSYQDVLENAKRDMLHETPQEFQRQLFRHLGCSLLFDRYANVSA